MCVCESLSAAKSAKSVNEAFIKFGSDVVNLNLGKVSKARKSRGNLLENSDAMRCVIVTKRFCCTKIESLGNFSCYILLGKHHWCQKSLAFGLCGGFMI